MRTPPLSSAAAWAPPRSSAEPDATAVAFQKKFRRLILSDILPLFPSFIVRRTIVSYLTITWLISPRRRHSRRRIILFFHIMDTAEKRPKGGWAQETAGRAECIAETSAPHRLPPQSAARRRQRAASRLPQVARRAPSDRGSKAHGFLGSPLREKLQRTSRLIGVVVHRIEQAEKQRELFVGNALAHSVRQVDGIGLDAFEQVAGRRAQAR